MEERSVIHSTLVIERRYLAPPERVFRAFSDPAKKRRWFVPDKGSLLEEFEMDFRVGGREKKRFRVEAGFECTNHTIYQDIVPDRRIVFVYTMSLGDHCVSSSQVTVELLPRPNGTDLVFTEQGAFFEGADSPEMRKGGWNDLLNQLEKVLRN